MIKLSFILFCTLLCIYPSGRSETAYSGSRSGGVQQSSPTIPDGCPPILEKWIEDDFSDKKSWGFKYQSEAKMCQSQVKSYQDFLTNNKKQHPRLSDSKKLSSFFAEKFSKKINSSYSDTIKKCNNLSPEKASAIQTRFYAAGTKLEAVNSSLLEEISYLDSVLPNTKSSLNDIECSAPIWPEIKEKCKELKTATQECSTEQAKQNRMDELVKKTQATIPQIQALTQAETNCKNSLNNTIKKKSPKASSEKATPTLKSTCDSITAALEIKKNEIPWIKGEDFLKIAVTKKPNGRNRVFNTVYDLSDETIKKAISQQFSKNLKALTSSYKTNLANFRCLSNKAKDASCNFEKIRTQLQALPDLRGSTFSPKDPVDTEASTYFEAESCLLERHEDRAQTKATIDNSMEGIAITAVTFGLGAATAGVRALNSTNHIAKIRQGLLASQVGLNTALTGQELKLAYQACSEETQTISDLSKTSNLNKENICSSHNSRLAQAKDQETNCLVTALLTAPSVLPFVGNLPALRALTSPLKNKINLTQGPPSAAKIKRDKEIEEFIAKAKSRGRDNRDLDFADSLTMEERVTVAESLLGKPLTPEQKDAIKKAHEAGPFSFDPNSPLTKEKDKILRESGFTAKESALLRGNGIAGGWGNWDETVKNGFRGQTASVPRSDGSQTQGTITDVIKRDERGHPTTVRVEWETPEGTAYKVVNIDKLKIDYKSGQSVFFRRTDGSFTQGTIASTTTDAITGKRKHTILWEENGDWKEKAVPNDMVSHIPPEARSNTNQQRSSTNSQQSSSTDQKNNNSSASPPPPPPPPPPRPEARPLSSFDQAASVVPKSNNRINYAADRPEMGRIVNSKGKIDSLQRIQETLNIPGQPSRDEIKQEVRRRIQKYNSDQNPDYEKVTRETSDALNDMKNFINNLERAR